jgi:hypothetical protein
MERGGDEEIVKLLRDIRENQGRGFLNPSGGGYLTKIPLLGACIGMIPLVDKIPLLGPIDVLWQGGSRSFRRAFRHLHPLERRRLLFGENVRR